MAEEAQIRDLAEKIGQERERLLALIGTLTEEAASIPPKPGEWTAKEQFSHLAEMESSYRAWVERALAEDNPNVAGTRGEPVPIPIEEANNYTVAQHLAAMDEQRRKTLDLIARITPEQYDRTATNPLFGTLTVLQWLRSFYRHDRMHIDQISGQEPSYRPRFAGGVEPDQRRRRP